MKAIINFLPFVVVATITINSSFAQYTYASKENIDRGEKIRSRYPDSKVYANESAEKYSFSIVKNKDKSTGVHVLEEETEELLSLADNYTFQKAIFYDTKSTVESVKVQHKKGKTYVSPYSVVTSDNPYSTDGIFHDDTRYKVFSLEFERLGNEKKYTIIKKTEDIRYFSSVYFHGNYPLQVKTITITVPDWLNLEIIEKNFQGYIIEKNVVKNEKLKSTVYTYTARDLDEVKSEINAPSRSFNWPHLLVISHHFTSNNQKNMLFSDIGDLYKWYNDLNEQVKNDDEKLKDQVLKLTSDKTDDMDKVKAIYYWIQDNIRYIAFEYGIAGFQPAPAHEVYQKKYGDCKGIANLMTHMLNLAGFDARFAWIGTRSIPYDFSTPTLSVNNHAICALYHKDKVYYLDGTESYIPLNDDAHRIQGKQVLIANGKTFDIKVVPDHTNERNLIRYDKKFQIQSGLLVGAGKEVYNGESRTMLVRHYNDRAAGERENIIKRWISADLNTVVTNIKTSDISQREKPIEINYDMQVKNKVTVLNDEMYVVLDPEKSFSNLIDEKRQNDYVFYSKILDKYQYELTIPNGYSVKHLPENIIVAEENFSIEAGYKVKGNTIYYSKSISFPKGTISKNDFTKWLAVQKQLKTFYNEQIILGKK